MFSSQTGESLVVTTKPLKDTYFTPNYDTTDDYKCEPAYMWAVPIWGFPNDPFLSFTACLQPLNLGLAFI